MACECPVATAAVVYAVSVTSSFFFFSFLVSDPLPAHPPPPHLPPPQPPPRRKASRRALPDPNAPAAPGWANHREGLRDGGTSCRLGNGQSQPRQTERGEIPMAAGGGVSERRTPARLRIGAEIGVSGGDVGAPGGGGWLTGGGGGSRARAGGERFAGGGAHQRGGVAPPAAARRRAPADGGVRGWGKCRPAVDISGRCERGSAGVGAAARHTRHLGGRQNPVRRPSPRHPEV